MRPRGGAHQQAVRLAGLGGRGGHRDVTRGDAGDERGDEVPAVGLDHLGVERVLVAAVAGIQRDPREVLDVVEGVQVRGVGVVRAPVPLGGSVIPAMQRRVEGCWV